MFVQFQSIHERARIWIYQANRKFNSQESKIISDTLTAFTQRWSVHGSPMEASFDLRFDQFIILAADEQSSGGASGCSIDDSVRTIKSLGLELNINFFDRTQIAFKKQEHVYTIPLTDLKIKLEEGYWDGNTLVFNNLINTKRELNEIWLSPASSTWLKRYLSPQQIVS